MLRESFTIFFTYPYVNFFFQNHLNGKLGLSLIERKFASKVFGDVVLPIILVTKGEEVTAGLGKLLTDAFRDL